MGIVINQSIKNTVITYIGFGIGAMNTLYLYVYFLGDTYYGLVSFILGVSNIIMPLMSFGAQNTLIKYANRYETDLEKSTFFTFLLALPLLFIIPFVFVGFVGYHQIASFFSTENAIVYDFIWQIPIIGICMGYFEIFYAWAKVHYHSVFGNFIKEVLIRLVISCLLLAVYFKWISAKEFMNWVMLVYFLAMIGMKIYAYRVQFPILKFSIPKNYKKIVAYSFIIILSGGIANMLLEIDKMMLNSYLKIENIAYYSVAIFIASVIAVPSRAMHQITHPITSKLMTESNLVALNELYKKTSITLQIIGGLLFLGIILNIEQLYLILPSGYEKGMKIVSIIGFSKYLDLILGNNNSIIFNSKYYKWILGIGILILIITVVLNSILIPIYGLNGAAVATLISITFYSYMKLFFVVKKMKLFPFTLQTIKSFGITAICFLGFYFWNFNFNPIINIILKSILITSSYLFMHYYFDISSDINAVMNQFVNYFRIKKSKI